MNEVFFISRSVSDALPVAMIDDRTGITLNPPNTNADMGSGEFGLSSYLSLAFFPRFTFREFFAPTFAQTSGVEEERTR